MRALIYLKSLRIEMGSLAYCNFRGKTSRAGKGSPQLSPTAARMRNPRMQNVPTM